MKNRLKIILVTFLILSCLIRNVLAEEATELNKEDSWLNTVWHQWAQDYPDWVEPIAPFRIIGNIYYIGTRGIGSYLIRSEQGHIVLDGGLPQNAKQIASNIESLGFALKEVKYLINSHAHFDHSGGLNELKAVTGAKLVASEEDAVWLENGDYPGSKEPSVRSIPVIVDRIIEEGDVLSLGSTHLRATKTPGHSPGCTSWKGDVTEGDAVYRVVFFCGASVAANRLVPDPQYIGIVEDYRNTFDAIKNWKVDVYLSNHPFYFGLAEKRAAQRSGDSLAFVDSMEFTRAVKSMKQDFEEKLNSQLQKAKLTRPK